MLTLEFFKHTIIFSMIIGISAVLIQNKKDGLSGFLYGALPIGFIYLLFVDNMGRHRHIEFSKETYIGGIYFVFYTFAVYIMCKYTNIHIIWCILSTMILFTLFVYLTKGYLFR